MRRKPNKAGLTLTDYRVALGAYKNTNSWAIRGYNNNISLPLLLAEFVTWKKANGFPLKRTRRIGLTTLQAGIQNDCNKIILKWARKRMLPEARDWLIKRFPHTESVVKDSEISQSAGAVALYEREDVKPGGGPIETAGTMIDPKYQTAWDREQELKKKG